MTRPEPGAYLTPRDLHPGMTVRHHTIAGPLAVDHIDRGQLPWVVVLRRPDGQVLDVPSRPDAARQYRYLEGGPRG